MLSKLLTVNSKILENNTTRLNTVSDTETVGRWYERRGR